MSLQLGKFSMALTIVFGCITGIWSLILLRNPSPLVQDLSLLAFSSLTISILYGGQIAYGLWVSKLVYMVNSTVGVLAMAWATVHAGYPSEWAVIAAFFVAAANIGLMNFGLVAQLRGLQNGKTNKLLENFLHICMGALAFSMYFRAFKTIVTYAGQSTSIMLVENVLSALGLMGGAMVILIIVSLSALSFRVMHKRQTVS